MGSGEDFLEGLLKSLNVGLEKGLETRREREKEERASAEKRSLADIAFQRQQQVRGETREHEAGERERVRGGLATEAERLKLHTIDPSAPKSIEALKGMTEGHYKKEALLAKEKHISGPEQSRMDYQDVLKYFTEARTKKLGEPEQPKLARQLDPFQARLEAEGAIEDALQRFGYDPKDKLEGWEQAKQEILALVRANKGFQVIPYLDEEGITTLQVVPEGGDVGRYGGLGVQSSDDTPSAGDIPGGGGEGRTMEDILEWLRDTLQEQRGQPNFGG